MKRLTASERKKIFQCDLDRCIAHELGHAVYALSRGCPHLQLSVSQQSIGLGSIYEMKLVEGQVQFQQGYLTKINKAALGFAGVLTEFIWEDSMDPFDYIECLLNEGAISTSDLKAIMSVNDDLRTQAFFRALKCVKLYRTFIQSEALKIKAFFQQVDLKSLVIHYDQRQFAPYKLRLRRYRKSCS